MNKIKENELLSIGLLLIKDSFLGKCHLFIKVFQVYPLGKEYVLEFNKPSFYMKIKSRVDKQQKLITVMAILDFITFD